MSGLDDTICAIATPVGEGGVGIIRISGPQSLQVASNVVILRSGRSLNETRSHTLCCGDIYLSSDHAESPQQGNKATPLDQVLVTVMRAPKSYTGEDVVEIHCHGGQLILSMVCELLLRQGARLAEPGEFTKRAFLNGRMDLTEAEAVLDTIRATTTASLKVAQEQLRGRLSKKIEQIRNHLIRILAHLEAGMDFVEEDISFIGHDELTRSLSEVSDEITELLKSAREGRMLREGVVTAIIGRPNVGKSSLLNALLDTDRAIVSTIPGTTRDVVEESLSIQGLPLRLLDTAGLRKTTDGLEVEGIRRTRDAIAQADLVLIVIDGSETLTDDDVLLIRENYFNKTLAVINKTDLPVKVKESDVVSSLQGSSINGNPNCQTSGTIVKISAKTGAGLDKLRRAISGVVSGSSLESRDSLLITRVRHQVSLERAKEAVTTAREALNRQLSGECLALDLRVALDALGEIIGVVSSDDILDHIFQEFCIGK